LTPAVVSNAVSAATGGSQIARHARSSGESLTPRIINLLPDGFMKTRLAALLVLPLTLIAYAAAALGSSPPPRRPPMLAISPDATAEWIRIDQHLESVERELRARDVSHLSPAQRSARVRHLDVLREYRVAGVYPHNHDFPGERVPYFVDEHGTLCAMAYLISRSDGDELVRRVAHARNNARIHELADEPDLVAWLEAAGITLDEAAMIQPMYGCCLWGPEREPGVDAGFAVASALTSAAGGVSIGLNLASIRSAPGSRWPGVLGIAAGTAGMALGLDRLADGGAYTSLAAATASVGLISTSVGAWNLFRIPADREEPIVAPHTSATAASVTASPLVDVADPGRVGLKLQVQF
jgi:hypothetical protein